MSHQFLSVDAARSQFGDLIDQLTTSQVADCLDVVGYRSNVLDRDIAPIQSGLRTFGPAVTIQFAPTASDPGPDPYRAFIDFMDSIPSGTVAVVATPTPDRSAVWGELFSAAAIGAGVIGMVTDGCTRDTSGIVAQGFAVFGRGRRPVDYRARQVVASTGQPVECGGVPIAVGDWVIADDDGVVAIPATVLDEVLTLATERARGESTVMSDLRAGAKLGEVWAKHGLL